MPSQQTSDKTARRIAAASTPEARRDMAERLRKIDEHHARKNAKLKPTEKTMSARFDI